MVLTEDSHLSRGKEGRWYTDSVEWEDLQEGGWETGRNNGNPFGDCFEMTGPWDWQVGDLWLMVPGEDATLRWVEDRPGNSQIFSQLQVQKCMQQPVGAEMRKEHT